MDNQILDIDTSHHLMAWVEVDLGAIAHNFEQLQKLGTKNMSHPGGIMPVIKAEAYGHGLLPVAQVLNQCGCQCWLVSNTLEGLQLREAGFKQRILILESNFIQEAKDIVGYNLTPSVYSIEMAQALNKESHKNNIQTPIHIKVDTGMGRLGMGQAQVLDYVAQIKETCPHLVLEGIYTHFPVAETDRDFTLKQMRGFRDIVFMLENQFITFSYVHASNSMGLGDYKSQLFNIARPGIMLYGLYPHENLKIKVHLKPAMTVKTRIMFLQTIAQGQGVSYGHTFRAKEDMTVAILPIGYSNGYLRSLSNKAFVLVAGELCPVIGRVTMDQIIVDVTPVVLSAHTLKVGDEVVLIGTQGHRSISAHDLASWADTISYEILCSLGNRLPRLYHGFKIL